MLFRVFNALLCSPLCIKRRPAFVFNHSQKFVQLSLTLSPAMLTNNLLTSQDNLVADEYQFVYFKNLHLMPYLRRQIQSHDPYIPNGDDSTRQCRHAASAFFINMFFKLFC
jgi:hypothetical protein